MPLVTDSNPFNKAPKLPEHNAELTAPEYKHSLVDSDKTPLDALLTQIEGISWTVDYYSQIKGGDEELSDFNSSEITPYQQYDKIVRYELKLQGELSTDFDDAQNRASVTGSAITYPKLKPNKGDVFIGDIGDGRAGRFTVTGVSQKSIFNNTCYEINFELVNIVTQKDITILDAHVVRTGYFDKDFLIFGQNPVLLNEGYELRNKLNKTLNEVLGSWLAEFYSYEIQSIRVPQTGARVVFDPFLTTAMVKTFGTSDHRLFTKINLYNCNELALAAYSDLWSALLSGEDYQMRMAFSKYQLVSSKFFNNNIHLRGIRYSNIDFVVMPMVSKASEEDPFGVLTQDTKLVISGIHEQTNPEVVEDDEVKLVVPNMVDSDAYVLNRNCYKLQEGGMTEIEQQVRGYFQGKKVNPKIIFKHTENRDKLTPLQRFYLMPICLFMMMVALREI